MTTLLLTFVLFLGFVLVLAGIAVMTGRLLKGSCGGVGGTVCSCRDEGLQPGDCETSENGDGLIQIQSAGGRADAAAP